MNSNLPLDDETRAIINSIERFACTLLTDKRIKPKQKSSINKALKLLEPFPTLTSNIKIEFGVRIYEEYEFYNETIKLGVILIDTQIKLYIEEIVADKYVGSNSTIEEIVIDKNGNRLNYENINSWNLKMEKFLKKNFEIFANTRSKFNYK
ncbi:MAG: hypothetical protein AB1489_17480 [Acidobacteriota bacterium]